MGYQVRFPNQRGIEVAKEECNKKNLYATINLEAMESAALDLDAGAFKLWCYFAKNQNGYTFALSSKDLEATFGMKVGQYNTAWAKLVDKGYLVQEDDKNNFKFIECPWKYELRQAL
jgi:hypothetical protein